MTLLSQVGAPAGTGRGELISVSLILWVDLIIALLEAGAFFDPEELDAEPIDLAAEVAATEVEGFFPAFLGGIYGSSLAIDYLAPDLLAGGTC